MRDVEPNAPLRVPCDRIVHAVDSSSRCLPVGIGPGRAVATGRAKPLDHAAKIAGARMGSRNVCEVTWKGTAGRGLIRLSCHRARRVAQVHSLDGTRTENTALSLANLEICVCGVPIGCGPTKPKQPRSDQEFCNGCCDQTA